MMSPNLQSKQLSPVETLSSLAVTPESRTSLPTKLCGILSAGSPDDDGDERPSTTYYLCRSCGTTFRTTRHVCPTCGGETFEHFDDQRYGDVVLNGDDDV